MDKAVAGTECSEAGRATRRPLDEPVVGVALNEYGGGASNGLGARAELMERVMSIAGSNVRFGFERLSVPLRFIRPGPDIEARTKRSPGACGSRCPFDSTTQ